MAKPLLPVLGLGAVAALGLYLAGFGTPKPLPRPIHAAAVLQAQRAFCNCLKTEAYLQECLAGSEQGDGREVNDQELLLSPCLSERKATFTRARGRDEGD